MTYIVDEKQVVIKDAIKTISPLNASQNLLVSEALKVVTLILLVLATNAVKTYLRSSVTQERLNSCLFFATYKEQVDKLNLVKVANQFLLCKKSPYSELFWSGF